MRAFSWTDHINDYWDEALNPGAMVPSLEKRVRAKIEQECTLAKQRPDVYRSNEDAALWARYQKIGLIDSRHMQFSRICNL